MKASLKTETLLIGETYHIYNKAVGDELLFKTEKDYSFFLNKIERFVLPATEIFCYCLLPNHFHLLLRVKDKEKESQVDINRAFSNFFISYSRSFNNVYNRLGRLFCQPYKRILVDDETYFTTLVNYIHRNPIHHGYVKDYSDWKYSSFNAFVSSKNTRIKRAEVLGYFYSIHDFVEFHEENRFKVTDTKYFLE